jgi:hypothetical protein
MDDEFLAPDEARLARELSLLPIHSKAAFASACAGRLAAALKAGGTEAGLTLSALSLLRAFVAGEPIGDVTALEARLLSAMPDEDSPDLAAALSEDALAAAAYALRCAANGHTEDAVWAARRAYETVDWLARQAMTGSIFTKEMEIAALRHPSVQTELRRQWRDLGELSAGGEDAGRLVDLVERSAREPALG